MQSLLLKHAQGQLYRKSTFEAAMAVKLLWCLLSLCDFEASASAPCSPAAGPETMPEPDTSSFVQIASEMFVDESDGIAHMQTRATLITKAQHHIQDLQRTLEKEGSKREEEVCFLLTMLESRYRGVVPWEYWGIVAQDLQALLVGYVDDCEKYVSKSMSDLARQFVKHWWSLLLPALQRIDQHNSALEGTRLIPDPADARSPSPVDLATPEHEPGEDKWEHEASEQAEREAHEEALALQAADQAEREAAEEAQAFRAVERFEEEQGAAQYYRRWEQAAMEGEMARGGYKRPRLRLTVTATSSTSTSASSSSTASGVTSSATLSLPVPPQGHRLDICLHLQALDQEDDENCARPVEGLPARRAPSEQNAAGVGWDAAEEDVEEDAHAFMQRPPATRATCLQVELRQWLRSLTDTMRARVVRHLLRALGARRCAVTACIHLLHAEVPDSSGSDDGVMPFPHFIQVTMDQFMQEMNMLEVDSRLPLLQPPPRSGEPDSDAAENARQRRTAASSSCLPTDDLAVAAGAQITAAVEFLRMRLDENVREAPPEHHHNLMRAIAQELARQVAERNGRFRILLLLLADILPLPREEAPVTSETMLVAMDAFREVLNAVDGLFFRNFRTTSSFMDFDWAAAALGPLGNTAIDVMSFLENANVVDMLTSPSSASTPEAMRPTPPRVSEGCEGDGSTSSTLPAQSEQPRSAIPPQRSSRAARAVDLMPTTTTTDENKGQGKGKCKDDDDVDRKKKGPKGKGSKSSTASSGVVKSPGKPGGGRRRPSEGSLREFLK